MTGIMWLASYPNSGNAWVRAFIANLFANPSQPLDIDRLAEFTFADAQGDLYEQVAGRSIGDMTDEELNGLRPQVHRLIAKTRPETVIVKTHQALAVVGGIPTITADVTDGAIYIVRNPLDVVVSYARRFGRTIPEAVGELCAEDNRIATATETVFQFLGSWSGHVTSWTTDPSLRIHVLRYEDVIREPIETFGAVAAFLGLNPPPERLKRAARFSSSRALRTQASRRGSRESGTAGENPFREDWIGQWRKVLMPGQVEDVVAAHAGAMERFGYLP